jgi:HEAT repeat protein
MALKRSTDAVRPLHEVQPRAHPRDRDGLIAALVDVDAGARRRAARDLAAHPGAAPVLGARLPAEPDAAVREAMFAALAGIGDAAAARALLPLLRSEDAMLRNGAIGALAMMPEAVAPFVEAQLADADPDVRILALNLLGELPHPRSAHWAADALARESQVNVAAAAVEVLADLGGPEHAPALRAAGARFAADPFVGFAVATALERVGSA